MATSKKAILELTEAIKEIVLKSGYTIVMAKSLHGRRQSNDEHDSDVVILDSISSMRADKEV